MCSHYSNCDLSPPPSPRSSSRNRSFSSSSSTSSSSLTSTDSAITTSPTTTNNTTITTNVQTLAFEQVQRLSEVISESIDINPNQGNFPTLSISPAQLIKAVRKRLDDRQIDIQDVRLNGSAASYCIAQDRDRSPTLHYNDLDIIFKIKTKSDYDLHVIKEEVLNSLFDFFPAETQTDRISSYMLEEYYVKKMVKVAGTASNDKWSLLCLGDSNGKNIELKFVDSMKRQYEFSIDSFQIILDPLLSFDQARESSALRIKLAPDFYPRVNVLSLFGDYEKALYHLNHRLIATKNPEQIRGGGLLKYCHLQILGYKIEDPVETEKQEPYMCSRFFIDFPSGNAQYGKIYKYVATRYLHYSQPRKALEFLDALLQVIGINARCLMESERYKTMSILYQIQSLITWHFGANGGNSTGAAGESYYFSPYHQQQQHHTSLGITVHWHHTTGHHHQSTNNTQHYYHSRFSSNNAIATTTSSSSSGSNTRRRDSVSSSNNSGSNSRNISPQPPSSPPIISFPHTSNNSLPIGPTPTPVR